MFKQVQKWMYLDEACKPHMHFNSPSWMKEIPLKLSRDSGELDVDNIYEAIYMITHKDFIESCPLDWFYNSQDSPMCFCGRSYLLHKAVDWLRKTTISDKIVGRYVNNQESEWDDHLFGIYSTYLSYMRGILLPILEEEHRTQDSFEEGVIIIKEMKSVLANSIIGQKPVWFCVSGHVIMTPVADQPLERSI